MLEGCATEGVRRCDRGDAGFREARLPDTGLPRISVLGSSVNSSNPPPLRLQPRIRQNDAFRGWRRAPSGSMLVLVLHKVGAKENAMTEQKSAGGLDFEAMRRAIEQLDADLLTSLYADDAEMLIV